MLSIRHLSKRTLTTPTVHLGHQTQYVQASGSVRWREALAHGKSSRQCLFDTPADFICSADVEEHAVAVQLSSASFEWSDMTHL